MRSKRRNLTLLALAFVLTLGWDVSRNPERQLTARFLVAGIHVYQATLSRAMPALGVVCRFEPSCSRYTEVSIRRHGSLKGSWLGLTRLARCGPWTPAGTVDPPWE